MQPAKQSVYRSAFPLNSQGWVYLAFILITSFFTYFYNYGQPNQVFWDEPYHIASAQKYLNNVYFMEQHPPLGKLLIALGQKVVYPKDTANQFIDTDYAKGFTDNYKFWGYRLFPTLLAWLATPILFFIFLYISKNAATASLFSFLYVFDNAMIVHSRGAMVDSPLTFFSCAMLLLFLMLLEQKHSKPRTFYALAAIFGLTFGLALATKLVGLILILLGIPILIFLYPNWRRMATFSGVAIVAALFSFFAVWQVHFSLGQKIQPALSNQGYYQASDGYKKILANGTTSSLWSFPTMMRDSLTYVSFYNKGVPRLDLCKVDENGSPFFEWPFGARSINYRWAEAGPNVYRYLYLQVNPVIWLCGLLGVILSAALLLVSVLFPLKEPIKHRFLMLTFLGMYASYMIAISQLGRVMYLYHYFLPLILSFLLFSLVVMNIHSFFGRVVTESTRVIALTIIGVLIFAAYQFYRPLTYYEPISNTALTYREIFPLWELTCANCKRDSMLVVPRQP